MSPQDEAMLQVDSWLLIDGEPTHTPHKVDMIEKCGSYIFYHLDDGEPYSIDELEICGLSTDWYNRIYDQLDKSQVCPITQYEYVERLTDGQSIVSVHQAQYELNKLQAGLGDKI